MFFKILRFAQNDNNPQPTTTVTNFSKIEDILSDARNGKMFILVDDENRENEGDLIIPAQMATPDAINFMAKYGRGLICLAMKKKRADELGLSLLEQHNVSEFDTAFTISIEAKEGVTTGISAYDRAHTIAVAINPNKNQDDITTPGHVFPIVAKEGGVLVRAGHTEAAVDIAKLAGLIPSGVICEIMNDDGTMARLKDLIPFAKEHGLKIATIADLIAYRRQRDKIIERVDEIEIETEIAGTFRLLVYKNQVDGIEHIALVKGKINGSSPALVHMHQIDVLSDILGDTFYSRSYAFQDAMKKIDEAGSGVLVLLKRTHMDVFSNMVKLRRGEALFDRDFHIKNYGVGAQILLDIGIKNMILLNDPKITPVGLEGYGLTIVSQDRL